jgi:monoamine oxidase
MYCRFQRTLQQANRRNLEEQGKPMPLSKEAAGWSRRRFMGAMAVAGGAGLAAGALPRSVRAFTHNEPRIAVIGGGIAGLNAAYQLRRFGYSATVYEARRRLGGRILSVEKDGLVLDLGGSFINTEHEDMRALASEFGVPLFNRAEEIALFPEVPEAAYFFEGRHIPETELADLLRPLAQQISDDADRLDADFDVVAEELDALSVSDYLDLHADRIPATAARTLIETSIRTEFGVEPNESSALQLIFNLPTVDGQKVEVLGGSDELFVVEGGSGRIIDALASALAGQIFTRRELRRIKFYNNKFYLHFKGKHYGEDYWDEADFVILALPSPALRHVDLRVHLPNEFRTFIEEADLGKNEIVIAGFQNKAWRRPDGFSGELWTDLGFSEAWEATLRQPERQEGALTFLFGGDEVAAIQSGSARSQGAKCIDRLAQVMPGIADATNNRFLRTRWAQQRFTGGAYVSYKPGQLTRFAEFFWIESDDPEERQAVNFGNLIFAGEQLSEAFYGFMNGGAETGRLATANDAICRTGTPQDYYATHRWR